MARKFTIGRFNNVSEFSTSRFLCLCLYDASGLSWRVLSISSLSAQPIFAYCGIEGWASQTYWLVNPYPARDRDHRTVPSRLSPYLSLCPYPSHVRTPVHVLNLDPAHASPSTSPTPSSYLPTAPNLSSQTAHEGYTASSSSVATATQAYLM